MFGGLVETTGVVQAESYVNGCKQLSIMPCTPFTDLKIGDSVAVNGVCLTVTAFSDNCFDCNAVPETLNLTNLKKLVAGSFVNLERSLRVDSRIGGHYVQGHVDGKGTITEIKTIGVALLVTIQLTEALTKYIVKKGYVAIDGMSITVVDGGDAFFTVTFIPHTQAATIVKNYTVGTELNIEVDILGKYAEKLLGVK